MVQTAVLAFLVFLIAVVSMAVGVLLTGRRITGSCGGLSAIDGTGHCNVCGRDMRAEPETAEAVECGRPGDGRAA